MGKDKAERRLNKAAIDIISRLLSEGYSVELYPIRVECNPTAIPEKCATGPYPLKQLPITGVCPGVKIVKVTRKTI